jgi:hypothetical protein
MLTKDQKLWIVEYTYSDFGDESPRVLHTTFEAAHDCATSLGNTVKDIYIYEVVLTDMWTVTQVASVVTKVPNE